MNDEIVANEYVNEYVTESMGFKTILTGGAGSAIAYITQINWVSFLTVSIMVIGFVIQIMAFFRGRRAEMREKEKHALEIALLKKQIQRSRAESE